LLEQYPTEYLVKQALYSQSHYTENKPTSRHRNENQNTQFLR
jgi:hypothetical protein